MDLAAQPADASVEIRRLFDATPEQLFAAWTRVDALQCWMGPNDEMETHVTTLDLRVGGQFRFRMVNRRDHPDDGPAGTEHVAAGEFVAIEPPRYLVFTWRWERNGMDIGESLVSVKLIPRGTQTELILIHEKLPDIAARDAHRQGWKDCLNCLEVFLKTSHRSPTRGELYG